MCILRTNFCRLSNLVYKVKPINHKPKNILDILLGCIKIRYERRHHSLKDIVNEMNSVGVKRV